jgi:hypothetical protein
MSSRSDLHRLIDELPEPALPAAERSLAAVAAQEAALPPFLRAAPIDDEPETEAERAAVAEARETIAAGDVISDEELGRELGP